MLSIMFIHVCKTFYKVCAISRYWFYFPLSVDLKSGELDFSQW